MYSDYVVSTQLLIFPLELRYKTQWTQAKMEAKYHNTVMRLLKNL